jgi:methylmalonyl-CoA mutase cobalamin-binding subunit
MRRYRQAAESIREAFTNAGITVSQLASNNPPEQIASEFIALLTTRSTPS